MITPRTVSPMLLRSLLQSPRYWFATAVIGAGLSLVACADPDGAFEDFNKRYAEIPLATSSSGTGGGGGAPACEVPVAGEVDGDYIFALSAKIAKKKPVLFLTTLTTADDNGTLTMSLHMQALTATDRKTPIGDIIDIGPSPVEADGSFKIDFPTIQTPGAANPVSGSLLESTVTIASSLCKPADFICGDVTGNLTKPLAIPDLTGSTFTMQRITDPAAYPDPVINCAKDPADPPPT